MYICICRARDVTLLIFSWIYWIIDCGAWIICKYHFRMTMFSSAVDCHYKTFPIPVRFVIRSVNRIVVVQQSTAQLEGIVSAEYWIILFLLKLKQKHFFSFLSNNFSHFPNLGFCHTHIIYIIHYTQCIQVFYALHKQNISTFVSFGGKSRISFNIWKCFRKWSLFLSYTQIAYLNRSDPFTVLTYWEYGCAQYEAHYHSTINDINSIFMLLIYQHMFIRTHTTFQSVYIKRFMQETEGVLHYDIRIFST